jgi:PAS domain S-box-containing protein
MYWRANLFMPSTGPDDQFDTKSSGFELLFEHTSDCIVEGSIQDGEPIVHRVNDAFESVFGYTNSELRGENLSDFITPDEKKDEVEAVDQAIREGDIDPREVTRQTADGPREFLLWATAGENESFYAIYTDITAEKERERKLERYEGMVENVPVGIYRVTPGPVGTHIFGNQKLVELFGASSFEELSEYAARDLYVNPEERSEFSDRLLEAGELTNEELKLQTIDGEEFWASVSDARVVDEDEGGVYIEGTIRDITELKERERQLQQERDQLDDFASIVSHDLRNPLNVAKGQLALARDECDSTHLDAVGDAHDRMQALIEDLLTLARHGEPVMDAEPITLPSLIEGCWQNIEAQDATVRVETDLTVQANKSRLQQLLENLLRNAVEHGGNAVTITIGDLDDGFYFADDGPGIPANEREQVFESGYSTVDEGTGFGLKIVKEIAKAHGWQIGVTESNDGGARFEITGVEFNTA